MGKTEKLSMTSSPSRGLLYPTPPEYDVFKTRRETTEDEIESAEETVAEGTTTPADTTESDTPMMTRANWTGTVPADD